jgi:hypothetical protein
MKEERCLKKDGIQKPGVRSQNKKSPLAVYRTILSTKRDSEGRFLKCPDS